MKEILEILLDLLNSKADAIGVFVIGWIVAKAKKKMDLRKLARLTGKSREFYKKLLKHKETDPYDIG
jgi:hypothetical protein